MGIVITQSYKNTISTYLGFALGGINTLFLFTNFLTDTYYGLVAFVLSTANIMMPFMAFGVHNTLIKYYSRFKTKDALNSFLTLMLFLPLALIIPIGLVGFLGYEAITNALAQENTIIKDYVWHIYILAIAMAYFEIFYAWSKTQLQTVFGNVMKEVFHRVGVMLLLGAVYLEFITVDNFINGIVIIYILRLIIMKGFAYSVRFPVLKFNYIPNLKAILKYAGLIIIAGSIATLILDIDKFMIGYLIEIEEVAYYSVAIFIATVIAVPQRAMHQIMMPLTAIYLNDKNSVALKDLYIRSSLNLLIISGFIFLCIVLNINELYKILPVQFESGLYVVLIISLAKLYDNILGNNNAILFNSDYYRVIIYFGVLLALLTIAFNVVMIPKYGINGAAIATFLAIAIYNTLKVLYVKAKFKMQPINAKTLKVLFLIFLLGGLFYFWDFTFHPLLNIGLKTGLLTLIYLVVIFKLNISEDINNQLQKYLKL
ncbi:MAG: polysaccharide biosynthesis C-terminal domain-containing protein [Bacteroidia bacterium]|nr:polysaccharide biosynthesis C-terminal domain-containing protein [Bacteroidia bacterium]